MRAMVYAPAGRRARQHQQECVAWCDRHGHQVVGLTSAPAAVEDMLARGAGDVVVVARDAHGRQLPDVPVMRIPRGRGEHLVVLGVPVGWLIGRARDHKAATATFAGLAAAVAAGLVMLPQVSPDADRRVPPEPPPAVAPSPPDTAPAATRPTSRPPLAPRPSRPAVAAPGSPAGEPVADLPAPTSPTSSSPQAEPAASHPPAPDQTTEPSPTTQPEDSPDEPNRCLEIRLLLGADLAVCLDRPART